MEFRTTEIAKKAINKFRNILDLFFE